MPSGPSTYPHAFFLAEAVASTKPALHPEDVVHATRVLRLRPGDLLDGLDGRGGRHPLRIVAVRRNGLELERVGPVERTPPPGAEGSRLPWVELAIAWPRRNRVEGMINRLVQLGASSIRPLEATQGGPEGTPGGASERLLRVAREACKQCGRLWMPELEAPLTPEDLMRTRETAAVTVLDPLAELPLDTWLRSIQASPAGLGTRARPVVLVVGPEGGLTEAEREVFLAAGASLTWLGPNTLRIETAAEAAMAIAAVHLGRPCRADDDWITRERDGSPQGLGPRSSPDP